MLSCGRGSSVNVPNETVCCRRGIIGWGRRGDPMQVYSVLTACAAHTNWELLLGLKVMKLPLS